MESFDIDALADWLDAEERHEDCLDIHGLHGFLTALCLSGVPISDEWLNSAIGEPLASIDETEAMTFVNLSVDLYKIIGEELYSDSNLTVTFEPTLQWQESDMEAWCQGFMEVVFEAEEAWAHADEEQLSLLLLPIEAASGFFSEEDDFKALYKQPKLLKQMFDDIPELLTDLYLLFHAPNK